MSKAKKKGATPAPAEPLEQPLEKITITVADPEAMKLILKSPDAGATATACQHLFKHAEKGDKEKMFLFTNELHTELIKQCLQHEDKATRYYALMCLGSMGRYDEILQALARNYDLHPIVVPMCAVTEGLVCQQHASFLVAAIARVNVFFAIQMWKNGAIPVIVPLLSAEDLDLKKNAIMAVAALAGDAEARNDLLNENIIPVLLEFLRSQYRDFQKNAIVALGNLCGSADFREVMRQANVFDQLLAVFRNKNLEDLHIGTLHAMACMMKDRESFEMMFDNGDVKNVLEVMKDGVGQSKKEVIDVVLRFLSALLHQDPMFASKLFDMGIVAVCEQLMGNEDEVICAEVCSLIGALSRHSMLCCEKFVENDSFYQHLVSHVECETRSMRDASTYCLVFSLRSKQNCRKFIESASGVTSLEVMRRSVQETSFLAQKNALNATMQILSHSEPKWMDILMERGFVEAFLVVLGCGDSTFRPRQTNAEIADLTQDNPYRQRLDILAADADPLIRKMLEIRQRSLVFVPRELMICAAACLSRFMTRPDGRQKLLAYENGPSILARNLSLCHGEERRAERAELCQAIMHACTDYDVAQLFTEAGGLVGLHDVLSSLPAASRPCSLATSCVTVVLNHHPIMMYWMTGKLMCSHVTQNGFYALAQFKPVRPSIKQPLSSLQQLTRAPRSDAVTVFSAYAAAPEPMKPTTPQTTDAQESAKPETGKEKQAGKAGKAKKGRKSDRETPKEEPAAEVREVEQAVLPVWTPAPDHDLWLAIDAAADLMRAGSHQSVNLKMRQLAQFVSERMGGAFSELDLRKGKLLHLEHIADLKVKLNSNVIPLGMIRCGTFMHRALLLKVLADRLFLPCTLHRGNGYTAWNSFPCTDSDHTVYLIDLMFRPGALLQPNTPAAQRYMSYH